MSVRPIELAVEDESSDAVVDHGALSWDRVGRYSLALAQVVTAALGVLTTIAVARATGPAGRGGYALLQSLTTLISAIALIGMPTLIVRSESHDIGAEASRLIVPITVAAMAVGCTLSICVALIYMVALPSVLHEGDVTRFATMLACVNTVVLTGREALASKQQAREQFLQLAFTRILWASMPTVAVVIAAIVAPHASYLFVAAVIGNLIGTTVVFRHHMHGLWTRIGRLAHARLWSRAKLLGSAMRSSPLLRSILGTHIALTLLLLVYRIDVMVLASVSTARQVGLYSVSYNIAELAWLAANAYVITLLPRLVRVQGKRATRKILLLATRNSVALAVAACIIGVIAARPTIDLILGRRFDGSYIPFLLLIPGIVAFVPFKIRATLMIARGRPRRLVYVCALMTVTNIVLNLIIDRPYGAKGSSVAASLTYMAATLALRIPRGNL